LWGGKWFHPTGNQSFPKTLSLARKQYVSLQRKTEQQTKKSTTMKNNSNNGQTEMNNTKKANRKMMQKANQKRIQAEANARRKVAKSWALLAKGVKYRKAAAKESCDRLTQILEDELFDGILLNLSGRNGMKSYTCQKRILRRIVEKRQAQSAHRLAGRSCNMFTRQLQRYCTSQSLDCLKRYQLCA
jgi:hypothetical protein